MKLYETIRTTSKNSAWIKRQISSSFARRTGHCFTYTAGNGHLHRCPAFRRSCYWTQRVGFKKALFEIYTIDSFSTRPNSIFAIFSHRFATCRWTFSDCHCQLPDCQLKIWNILQEIDSIHFAKICFVNSLWQTTSPLSSTRPRGPKSAPRQASTNTFCGTLEYIAPEARSSWKKDGCAAAEGCKFRRSSGTSHDP